MLLIRCVLNFISILKPFSYVSLGFTDCTAAIPSIIHFSRSLYIYGYGVTSTGEPFSVTEHMNRETKGVVGPLCSWYCTNYESLNKLVITCHIYYKLRIIFTSLKNKLAEYNFNRFSKIIIYRMRGRCQGYRLD